MSSRPARVTLVETTPDGSVGSMAGYAELLVDAISGQVSSVAIERLNLARGGRGLLGDGSRFLRRIGTFAMIVSSWRRLKAVDAEILHLVDGSQAHLLRFARPDVRTIATAHDLIPLLQARGRFAVERPGVAAQWLVERSRDGLCRADMIIAVSRSTSDDVVAETRVPASRIRIVHPALRADFSRALSDSERSGSSDMNADAPVILHLGNNGFYKNRVGVLRIFSMIRRKRRARLVMAGPAPDSNLERLVRDLGLGGDVEFVVDPPIDALMALYRTASVFLFPSVYEGFGWPPLEAMAVGCPVVCSNVASLPEVVGDAALTGDPHDEQTMAQLCEAILDQNGLADELRARGLARAATFTPDKMGREIVSVYEEVLGRRLC